MTLSLSKESQLTIFYLKRRCKYVDKLSNLTLYILFDKILIYLESYIISNLFNMNKRKQKIEELIRNFQPLRRAMALGTTRYTKTPRITPSQWGVLMLMEQLGESTVKNVAKALGITSSATTQLIDGLVASGYVVREIDKKDRRAVTLTLSKKTKTEVNKMKKEGLQKFMKFFEDLNDKELDQYILLNRKIVERLLKK